MDAPSTPTTTRPRIAMVSTHGYVAAKPDLGAVDTGGQVVYVLELSKKLAQLGFDVDIWTRRFDEQPAAEPVAEGVRILRMPCGPPGFVGKEYLADLLPEWSEHARRYIAAERLRYGFVNSHYWDGGVAGQFLADVLGVPHLHTPHSLGVWKKRDMEADFPDDAATFESRYNFSRRIENERQLYRTSDIVIATTPTQVDLLASDYDVPADKVRMIPPGYDDNRFFPIGEASRRAIRERTGRRGSVVFALGRLARNKGYDLLIRSFRIVAERVPDARLVLAVGGTSLSATELALREELQRLALDEGLAERIDFEGYIDDSALADAYRAADVFVLSSRYEPFGMTAVEAMACGTPTVVTIHGGLYRALTFGRHALYADPLDREDLGITITKILRHPRLRHRLSRMGAHKARSLFTWTGIAQQLVALVEHRTTENFFVGDAEWDEPWNDAD